MISTKGIRQCETLGSKTLARWLKSGALLGTMDGRVLLGIAQTSKPSPTAFYAPDFFLQSASPWLFYKQYRSVSLAGLVRALAAQPACANDDWVWTSPSFSPFERIFGDLQNEIHQNRLQKGVPFAFERAHIPGDQDGSPARLVAKLRSVLNYATGRAVMPYGFWSNARGTAEGMLGCTPETLFQQDGSQVQTMAIAGTRIAGEENRLPLMEDPKERSEHQIVIDAIVSSVRPLGEVQVKTTGVAHYATLSHLKTAIALELNGGTKFDELVAALHPTPALGAYPKQYGWQWLRKMEAWNGMDRGRFGAPFGITWGGGAHGHCVVAIRNIQWTGSDAVLCAGCGVNGMAVVENEWNEIRGKIAATRNFLGLADAPQAVHAPAFGHLAAVTSNSAEAKVGA